MLELIKNDLIQRLNRLDEDASLMFEDNKRFYMVIAGGSALILLGVITRMTHDIDALSVSKEIQELLDKYDINCRVQTYINNFPYKYEERLVPLRIGGRKIDFFAASLEDIIIAKLHSPRDTDLRDIESEAVINSVDWALLEKLALDENEARASALNERSYNEFKSHYDNYVRRFRPCES